MFNHLPCKIKKIAMKTRAMANHFFSNTAVELALVIAAPVINSTDALAMPNSDNQACKTIKEKVTQYYPKYTHIGIDNLYNTYRCGKVQTNPKNQIDENTIQDARFEPNRRVWRIMLGSSWGSWQIFGTFWLLSASWAAFGSASVDFRGQHGSNLSSPKWSQKWTIHRCGNRSTN